MASNKKRLKKYKISGKSLVFMIILAVVSGGAYGVICYFINVLPAQSISVWVLTAKDIFLIILTISGTNLLVSTIIEVNSQNKLISDFFTTDIVTSPVFYKNIDIEERKKMLEALELLDNCQEKEQLYEMYNSIKAKMYNHIEDDYYFEKSEFNVRAIEEQEYIRKNTTKTVYVKSYKPTCSVKGFNLANIVCDNIPNCLDKAKLNVTINDKSYDFKSLDIKPLDSRLSRLQEKNGYSKIIEINFKKSIEFSSTTPVKISFYYELLSNKTDLVSTYRTKHPCKAFSVMFSIKPADKYKLKGQAFGFHERASDSTNPEDDNVITMGFDDWIFTDDGICITMIKK